jgi:predicted TIM-barrel fold metal-dependent hydrolase
MKECPNIVMETSGMYAPDNMIGVVEKLGTKRLIFGSHSPWMNLEFEVDRVNRLGITDMQREAVFGGNILELLGKN